MTEMEQGQRRSTRIRGDSWEYLSGDKVRKRQEAAGGCRKATAVASPVPSAVTVCRHSPCQGTVTEFVGVRLGRPLQSQRLLGSAFHVGKYSVGKGIYWT